MDAEPEFANPSASTVEVAGSAGIMANEFEENESDREPSKSISGPFKLVGAALFDVAADADMRRKEKENEFPVLKHHCKKQQQTQS